MENWDEVKTAFQVARMGTVSGAADALGVHHATVIRHVDALEGRLGVKLFQRHARGYTATEAGEDLLRVAQATEDQFGQLLNRIKGRGTDVSGELVVTSLVSMTPHVAPLLAAFQREHPEVIVRYMTGDRLFRLEYGEAHVAMRAGVQPDQPDNVVQAFAAQRVGLYAARSYVAQYGVPTGPEDYVNHRFVGHDDVDSRAPHFKWMSAHLPRDCVVYRSRDNRVLDDAVRAGAGIGFLSVRAAAENPDLIEIEAPRAEWEGKLWLVTHVDLHRTSKVQALLTFLKAHVSETGL
ncbi:LysR family transcriptional regulator [Sulfitobacter sp. S190]|uniref:LysR family transcriptional regulator n=1 Tax=Sulfitobacter sp. S190 TaxID=2867022 RepID=UPI0021A6A433|nr:LysR family transcriptional regulator [Sulfitobacter sp. S190]UWR22866.1 LysR family transcriptional regulator [Sulfitobacter sp. S190]